MSLLHDCGRSLMLAIPMCIGGQKGNTSACQVAEKLHTQDSPIRIEEVNNNELSGHV